MDDISEEKKSLESSIAGMDQEQFERTTESKQGAAMDVIDSKKLLSMTAESLSVEGFLRPVQQTIQFNGTEKPASIGIYGNDVIVYPHQDSKEVIDTGSSMVQVSQVSKFDWEQKYYFGNMVASNQNYLAYVVKVRNSQDDKVRVLNHHTSAKALLKGFQGSVVDLAFDTMSKDLLACADCYGNVYLYLIQEGGAELKFSLVQSISRGSSMVASNHCCISWIPTFQDWNDTELLLASSYENSCTVFDLTKLLVRYRSSPLELQSTTEGTQTISDGHIKPITKLSVSPDGAVLATSSLDGHVKFWGIDMDNSDSKRCLHDWIPHNGEPVTCLFFCDNYSISESTNENPSWRFVITGTKFNTEIKVWCAVRWTCLQTIQFDIGYWSSESVPAPCVKPMLDTSAGFFLCTDIKRQVLYVFQLYQNSKDGKAHFSSLSEFLLAQSMLSFVIDEVRTGKAKKETKGDADLDDGEDEINGIDDEDQEDTIDVNEYQSGQGPDEKLMVSLKLFAIHTKALQKLSIKFNPKCSVYPDTPTCSMGASAEDQLSIQDRMSDVSGLEGLGSHASDVDELEATGAKLDLLTDDRFEQDLKTSGSVSNKGNKSPANSFTMVTSLSNPSVGGSTAMDAVVNGEESTQLTESCLSGSEREEEQDGEEDLEQQGSPDVPVAHQLTILKRGEPLPTENRETSQFTALSTPHDSDRGLGSESESEKSSLDGRVTEDREEMPPRSRSPKEIHTRSMSSLEEKEDVRVSSLPSLKDIQIPSVDMPLKSSIPYEMLEARDRDLQTLNTQSQRRASESMAITPAKIVSIAPANDGTTSRSYSDEFKQIVALLEHQQSDIKHLTELCTTLSTKVGNLESERGLGSSEASTNYKQSLQSLQRDLNSQLSKATRSLTLSTNQTLEKVTTQIHTSVQQREEKQLQDLAQIITNAFSNKMEKIIKSEIKGTLLPGIQRAVSSSLDHINAQVAQKISVIERTLKEEIGEMLKSPVVMNAIGTSVSKELEGTIPSSYRDAFKNLLLPAYEKACKAMFDQINGAFQQGTGQYIQKLETHLEKRRQQQADSQNPLILQLQGLVESFQATADRLTGSLESNLEALMAKQIADSFDSFQRNVIPSLDEKVTSVVKEALKSDVEEVLEKHRDELLKGLSSGAYLADDMTLRNAQQTVQSAIDQRDYSTAFEAALTASDLVLVDLVCRSFNPSDVFGEVGALSQPIILSLVQQLSVDLPNDIDFKANYLKEALLALDSKDEVTTEHIPVVIGGLIENLNKAMESPKVERLQMKNLRFLLMVAKSLNISTPKEL